ncbi:MAG: DUF4145 domain-containing protein [Bacteroidia bacterium]|nr:DUF4145 domain-containing protein [Bacteroidia bacterium]
MNHVNVNGPGKIIYTIRGYPNVCPYCKTTIVPVSMFAYNNRILEVFTVCTADDCRKSFIAYYVSMGSIYNFGGYTSAGNLSSKTFEDAINLTSSEFCIIYNEAFQAEQAGLLNICGAGYRKSLEFLIKDYAISKNVENHDAIKKMPLSQVIKKYIDNPKIVEVSTRAAWIGNDETHYIKIWTDLDLSDLKNLIDLIVKYIEMEALHQKYVNSMQSNAG